MAGRILIADITATNRIILKVKLGAARYDVLQAASTDEVLARARSDHPDMVIVDAHLPGSHDGGVELTRAMKADEALGTIPVIVTDAVPARDTRLAALAAGADDYLAKPFDEVTLLALVRHLMRAHVAQDELTRRQDTAEEMGFAETAQALARPPRIALIAPGADAGATWRDDLATRIDAEISVIDRDGALDRWDQDDLPDAFVIGADLARHHDGLMLVSELRSRPATRHAVIAIHDDKNAPETVPMALDLGANAVVAAPFDAEEIAVRLTPLLARKFQMDGLRATLDARLNLALRDPLTGLYNRRYAESYMRRIIAQAAETGQPFAVMLLDLDRFKSVNDTWGHPVGDAVLVETARRLAANVREVDLLVRHGGEEFLIALPATDLAAASAAAERLRQVIGETPIAVPVQDLEVPVTISIGVTVCTGDKGEPSTLQGLVDTADRALYASKSDGRNQVSFAGTAAA